MFRQEGGGLLEAEGFVKGANTMMLAYFMVVVGKQFIFLLIVVLGEIPTQLLKIVFALPFQRQPRLCTELSRFGGKRSEHHDIQVLCSKI